VKGVSGKLKKHSRKRKNVKGADKVFRKQILSASGGLTHGILEPFSSTKLENNQKY
jgi:hypothetical protein